MFLFDGEKQSVMEIHLNFEEGMYDVNGKPIIMVHIVLALIKISEATSTY